MDILYPDFSNILIMTPPVTLKELARLLNLAPSTVSRALRGHPDISRSTQERVKALAQHLQYYPNSMATGLRNRHFNLIAVVIPVLTDYYYAAVLHGMVSYAYEKAYKIVVFETGESCEKEEQICLSLKKAGIDGLLISPAKTTVSLEHLEELRALSLPIVFFDRMLGNFHADRVMEDDYYGACLAVNFLIKRGCRKIAHLAASQQWLWAQKRQMGYVQALLDHHIPVNREFILDVSREAGIEGEIQRLIRHFHIDALFAVDDESAVKALTIVRNLGYLIPEEISVCGYGDSPVAAATYPSLTTVARNGVQIGKEAAEILIRRIENPLSKESEIRLLKGRLMARNSTR